MEMSFFSDSMSRIAGYTCAIGVLAVAACTSQPDTPGSEIALAGRADSVAMMVYESAGGNAWDDVRFLRFDFAVEHGGDRGPTRRHLWNRMSGDYRIEWPMGGDSTAVVMFNVHTREGSAFVNGAEVAGESRDRMLEAAYSRYINDTYWLMAPAKVFDPGVTRDYMADSSSGDAEVIHLSFDNVGLTPGDQYWISVDPETGRVMRWTYLLQGASSKSSFDWVDYREFSLPEGTIRLAERKEAIDGARAILTDNVDFPPSVPADLFSSPAANME